MTKHDLIPAASRASIVDVEGIAADALEILAMKPHGTKRSSAPCGEVDADDDADHRDEKNDCSWIDKKRYGVHDFSSQGSLPALESS